MMSEKEERDIEKKKVEFKNEIGLGA